MRLAVKSNANKILVRATPGTIHSERLETLVKENQRQNQAIDLLPCPGLADTIEFNLNKDDSKINNKLEVLLNNLPKDYDSIVLGCTHYSLIKPLIQEFFPSAELVDGNEGIAKRVKELVK